MYTYKYHGELGYFIQIILSPIERYIKRYSERRGSVTLYTYKGYDTILESLFPGYFLYVTDEISRQYRRAGNADDYYTEKYKDIPFLHENLEEYIPAWLGSIQAYTEKNYVSYPIQKENMKLSELQAGFEQTYVFFLRNRSHEEDRNCILNDNYISFLKSKCENSKNLVVLCSMNSECLVPEFLKTNSNVYECKELDELLYFFSTCTAFYTNNSGIEDLAKVCACKEINVIPNSKNQVVRASVAFNPFQTKVNILDKENIYEQSTNYQIVC